MFHPFYSGGMLDAMLRVSPVPGNPEIPAAPWFTLQDSGIARSKQRPSDPSRQRDAPAPRVWHCVACNWQITGEEERIAIAGDSVHRRINPMGIEFEFGCFGTAPGCRTVGEETSEHSWFVGYRWRVALCGRCHTHLGWRFQSAADRFYGLIVGRMRFVAPDTLH